MFNGFLFIKFYKVFFIYLSISIICFNIYLEWVFIPILNQIDCIKFQDIFLSYGYLNLYHTFTIYYS